MIRRLVIFDVDGTLIDSQRHIHTAMVSAFTAEGISPPPLADVLAIVGLSLPEAMARLAPAAEPAGRDRLVRAYKDSFAAQRVAEVAPPYPGALAALDRLASREGTLLGIATGKSRRGLDHVLGAHGLSERFVTRQVADDHPSKPHPAMLLAALAETGTAPGNAVMIGDSTYDMEMARAAGVAAIGVSWGYHAPAALAAAGARTVLAAFEALDAALDTLWTAPA